MRPSLVMQYICFGSLAACPWALLFVPWEIVAAMAACWAVLGIVAALWNRNVEDE